MMIRFTPRFIILCEKSESSCQAKKRQRTDGIPPRQNSCRLLVGRFRKQPSHVPSRRAANPHRHGPSEHPTSHASEVLLKQWQERNASKFYVNKKIPTLRQRFLNARWKAERATLEGLPPSRMVVAQARHCDGQDATHAQEEPVIDSVISSRGCRFVPTRTSYLL